MNNKSILTKIVVLAFLLTGATATHAAQMNGTYTINPSGTASSTVFKDFASAITYLTSAGSRVDGGPSNSTPFGVSGAVVFQVAAGTYSLSSPIVVPQITGTSNVNTVTFDGTAGNAATRILTGSFASSAVFIMNQCKYVGVSNLTITNTASSTSNFSGLGIVGSASSNSGTGCFVTNCVINVPNTSSSYTSYGINVTPSSSGYGTGTTWADSLRIDSNTINGGYYGFYMYGYTSVSAAHNRDIKIRNNTLNNTHYYGFYIYYVQNGIDLMNNVLNMDASSAAYGIYMYYCRNHFSGNQSHRVIGNRTQGHYYNYIYYSSAGASNPTQIYNNVVSNLRAGTNYGFYVYNGSGYVGNFQIYHNSINLTASSSGYCIYYYNPTTGGSVEMKNNIFSVSSGTAYPVYCSTNPTGNVINYNAYYNTANSNIIYRGSLQTSSTFNTATAGGDSSLILKPAFVSTVDLHLTDACAARGVDLTAFVPTDMDNHLRSTSPHIGADEVPSFGLDLSIAEILTPVAPIITGYQDLAVRVKNVGGTSISSFDMSYVHNSSAVVTQSWSGTLAPCDTVTVVFSGSTQVNLGVSNSLKIYTANVNYAIDSNPSNDTLVTNLYAPLNGNYTVGGSGANYATIGDAVAALASGVGGPVVFTVAPGTYTGQVVIDPVAGASASSPVIFDGVNAATRIVTSAATSQATVVLNGCKHVTLRSLTITNTSATPVGVAIIGNTSSDNGSSNTIKKCVINLPNVSGSSTSYGISQTATAWGYGATATWIDSTLIDSNVINKGYYGVSIYGGQNPAHNLGIQVTNNTFTNQYQYGLYWYYCFAPMVVQNNDVNMDLNGSASNSGMYLYAYGNTNNSTTVSTVISGNRVRANYGGIWMYYLNGTSSAPTLCYNNYVHGFTYSTNYGLYAYNTAGYYYHVYHNNIQCESGTGGYGVYWGSTFGELKNNIISITATGGTMMPVYCSTAPSGTNPINYNVYWNTANANVIYRSTQYTNSTFQTSSAGGDSSFYMSPPVTGATDFHLTDGCKRGVDLTAVVPVDIEGDVRTTSPNIGCDEYPGIMLDVTPIAIMSPVFPVSAGSQNLKVRLQNNGTTTVTALTISYRLNGGTAVTNTWSGSMAPCATDSFEFTGSQQVNIAANVANTIKVFTSNPNYATDSNATNDTLNQILATPMAGTYTIGATASDFTTFGSAVASMQVRGVGGNILFNVRTGTYNESVSIASLAGISAGSTVTFTSMANQRDSVVLNAASGTVFTLSNASYVNLMNLTLNQQSMSGTCLAISGTASYDTIYNCYLKVPVTSSTSYIVNASGSTLNGVTFRKNLMQGGYYGLYLYSNSAQGSWSNNVVVDSNTIQQVYIYNQYLYYHTNIKVRNNTYVMANGLNTYNYLYSYYCDSASEFSGNTVTYPNSSTYGYIYWYYSVGNAGNRVKIFNNRINTNGNAYMYVYLGYNNSSYVDIYNNAFSLGTGYWGIGSTSNNIRVYNNTVQNAYSTYGLYLVESGTSNIDVRNNVIANTGGGPALYWSGSPSGIFTDYNNLYSTGSSLVNGSASGSTLAAWRAVGGGRERNSLSYRPAFTGTNNLSPNASDTACWSMNGRGIHLANITTDINGVARPATVADGVPDLGAFEFTPVSVPPLLMATPSTPAAAISSTGGIQSFLFGSDTVAKIAWDMFTTPPSSIAGRFYSGTKAPNIGNAPYYMNAYWQFNTPAGYYYYGMTLHYKDAWLGTVPNEVDLKMAKKSATSSWVIYPYSLSTADTGFNTLTANGLTDFSDFTGTDNTNPLPVKLSDIFAKRITTDAVITWTTASEKNARVFEIERSVDGRAYEHVGSIAATGNTSDAHAYSFTDPEVQNSIGKANVVYYRLKIKDMDGSFEYSKAVPVIFHTEVSGNTMSAYPNPFGQELSVMVRSAEGGEGTLVVVDVQGRELLRKSIRVQPGEDHLSLNELASLKQGIYFINLGLNGETLRARILRDN